MTPFVAWMTHFFALGTILMQIAVVVILVDDARIKKFIDHYGTLVSLLLSLGAIGASFFYSSFARFVPCALCYVQRYTFIALAILLALYLLKKKNILLILILAVVVFGIVVSGYHSYLQAFPTAAAVPGVLCAVLHSSVSCSLRYFYEFGYISMPLMSLSAFALIFFLNLKSAPSMNR